MSKDAQIAYSSYRCEPCKWCLSKVEWLLGDKLLLTCRVTTILGVRKFLRYVLGREQVAKPKPDPAIYLAAAKNLGVAPERYNLFPLVFLCS